MTSGTTIFESLSSALGAKSGLKTKKISLMELFGGTDKSSSSGKSNRNSNSNNISNSSNGGDSDDILSKDKSRSLTATMTMTASEDSLTSSSPSSSSSSSSMSTRADSDLSTSSESSNDSSYRKHEIVSICSNCQYSFRCELLTDKQFCSKDCRTSYLWYNQLSLDISDIR